LKNEQKDTREKFRYRLPPERKDMLVLNRCPEMESASSVLIKENPKSNPIIGGYNARVTYLFLQFLIAFIDGILLATSLCITFLHLHLVEGNVAEQGSPNLERLITSYHSSLELESKAA